MNFFKRYYDKVILLCLFVMFLGLMLKVLEINQQTQEISQDDLRLPTRNPDHQSVKNDKEHNVHRYTQLWKQLNMQWSQYHSGSGSDLVAAQKLAACPYCAEKAEQKLLTLIPFSDFGAACPVCNTKLTKPTAEQSMGRMITANDSDGDGISNEDEAKYGLNPEDERDANYDLDGDGFSNRYEIANKTRPDQGTSHPPLWHRLHLVAISTVKLPISVKSVNVNNSNNPNDWEFQYNLPQVRRGVLREVSRWASIGSEIQVDHNDKRRYRVVSINLYNPPQNGKAPAKPVPAAPAAAGKPASGDEKDPAFSRKYIIVVEEVRMDEGTGALERLELITGEPVYSKDQRPVLVDTGIPGSEPFTRRINTEFIISRYQGRRLNNKTERYRVIDADVKNNRVTLALIAGGFNFDISKAEKIVLTLGKDAIPREDWVRKREAEETRPEE